VSFGFLIAPHPTALKQQLAQSGGGIRAAKGRASAE
jgi:hypothetical protein